MNWATLYEMQSKLDTYIIENKQLDLKNKNLFEKKYLALIVELSELANETRSFKFWSTNDQKDTAAILEEYVDGLHFILSLGIDKGHSFNGKLTSKQQLTSETQQFNLLFEKCVMFKSDPTKDNYNQLFQTFLQLGYLLGFNETDIQTAYYKKNEVNFSRQDEGY